MTLSRRHFLGLSGGAAIGATLGGCALASGSATGNLLRSSLRLPGPFTVPLPVPAVAVPTDTTGGTDHFAITQRHAEVEILPGTKTPILGYDGQFPGPTVPSRTGRPVIVEHINELDIPSVVHLHGGHTPAASDGFPTDYVLPRGMDTVPGHHQGGTISRGSFAYEYPMTQRAATLWYHDHRMDFTGPAVYHGLAGFHLIHDDEEEALPLPGGDRDIPLMITDRAFEADGAFRYPALDPTMLEQPGVTEQYMAGVLGDVVLVNGAPWPELDVDAVRYRFRILNASNARRYDLRLDPRPPQGASFTQIGSDGGLLAAPLEHPNLRIAPAERFDVVIDFSAYPVGSLVTLTNAFGTGSTKNVMRFRIARKARDDSNVPPRLSRVEGISSTAGTLTREFTFTQGPLPSGETGWLINGRAYDPARIDSKVPLGDIELWRFITDVHHPIHVHLEQFQVTRRGGGGPGPFDTGWKDTIDLRPGEVVEVAIRMTDYAGTYVMHCHNLEHEDMMMMSNFQTLR
ncbi:multicopper oxidase domain-containing protein [Arthrobacter castelli]|uniref:multicopper oxidase domain-containing protein n=1 Tax=Arthrobacter castelli TaxID=271431 RepID=UPI00040F342D|nr:multicopper oxidase domain-containing protein [Arthrobacter castelli]